MKPIVRATQVEAFRRWFFGNASYITEQSVIDNITHEFSGNNLTRIGTAFHRICQFGNSVPMERVDAGERKFTYYNKPKSEPVPNGIQLNVDGHNVVFDGYSDAKHIEDVRGLELKRITPPITCRRYAAMEDDICYVLREMYAWLQYRDLLRYLKTSI